MLGELDRRASDMDLVELVHVQVQVEPDAVDRRQTGE
jgi:hypothetical protein